MNRADRSPSLQPGQSRVMIVGCGYVGRKVARLLADRDVSVVGATRSATWSPAADDDLALAICPQGVAMHALDITRASAAQIADLSRDATHWLLCYAPGGAQDREQVYLSGLDALLAAARLAKPKRIVYTSSTSALPDIDGLLDESCAMWPDHARGRIQREAEQRLIQAAATDFLDVIILRLAGIYGPGRPLGKLYRSSPHERIAGDGMQATNLIHRDDAAAAVVAAMEIENPTLRLIHVCDDDHSSRRSMLEGVARSQGLPLPRFEVNPADPQVRGKIVHNRAMKEVLALALAFPRHNPESLPDEAPSGRS
jgi:nucleoside-diphosphate-sugar epimerase